MAKAVAYVYGIDPEVPNQHEREGKAFVKFLNEQGWVIVKGDSAPAEDGAIQRALGI